MTGGTYGAFGRQYAPGTPIIVPEELENVYEQVKDDTDSRQEFQLYLREYANRLSLLYYAGKMSEELGGIKIYLKWEDLSHTGAHKVNNMLGRASLAKRVGKTKITVETGTGQYGVAPATATALLGMEYEAFVGVGDTCRQSLSVFKTELLGATVTGVSSGTGTLKDACNEAMRAWASCCGDTLCILGSAVGPHPYPMIVRDFQKIISEEMKAQRLEKEGHLPDAVIACVGGGSNVVGTFYDFLRDEDVALIGCKAAEREIHAEQHATTIARDSIGVLHDVKSLFPQDDDGQIMPVYSISAGLNYPGIGLEHADLAQSGRMQYVSATDDEAIAASLYLIKTEGIIPVIKSNHTLVYTIELTPTVSRDSILAVTLSGRGDKDVKSTAECLEVDIHEQN